MASLPPPSFLKDQTLPEPRQQRSREKRQKLLDAALDQFSRHSYDAVRIEDIALQAGLPVGTFYQHFASKKQLLLVLMEDFKDQMLQMSFQMDPSLSLQEGMYALVKSSLEMDLQHLGAFRAFGQLIPSDPEMAELFQQFQEWVVGNTVLALRMTQQHPKARQDLDLESTARLFNLLFWKLLDGPSPPDETLMRALASMMLHTLFQDAATE